jgi:hypothetical protein
MDYTDDEQSRMFTPSQVDVMRSYLSSHPEYTRLSTESIVTNTTTETTETTDSWWTTERIIGITIGALIAFVAIMFLIYYFYVHKKPSRNDPQNPELATE